MPHLLLYSTNPWYATHFARRYAGGRHAVWCSQSFDPGAQDSISWFAAVAPTSSPRRLFAAVRHEDEHDEQIARYKDTFTQIARLWHEQGRIGWQDRREIVADMRRPSWRIWRPLIYLIPRQQIEAAGRLRLASASRRASVGPEWRIVDLMPHEFDIMDWRW